MNKAEKKYYNTATKMHEALFALLEKKNFSDISVVELCAQAKVNRSTFYAHYDNTNDLLKDAYSNTLTEFFKSYRPDLKDVKTFDDSQYLFISPEYLIPYLLFIKENRTFFILYMDNAQYFDTDDTYSLLLDKIFLPACQKNGLTDKVVVNYTLKFYLQGITAITLEWAKNGCKDDVNFICEIITGCIRPHNR